MMAEQDYAGDISSRDAWEVLTREPEAVLVDVRTDAEWRYVGVADLSALGRKPLLVAWQVYPHMHLNRDFASEVQAMGVRPDQTVLLICRSGQRSRHAAIALSKAGFKQCYNVADGFEGPHDEEGHRGTRAGWKAAGLPWTQG